MARKETRKDGFWDTLKTVFWALVIAMVFRSALYQPFSIPSGSMKPTLLIGDYLFVSKFAYGYSHYSLPFSPDWFEGPLGMVAGLGLALIGQGRGAPDDCVDYVKRVIGLPGDRIQVRAGILHINGVALPTVRDGDFVEPWVRRGSPPGLPRCVNRPPARGGACAKEHWRETLPGGRVHSVLNLIGIVGDPNPPRYSTADNTEEFLVPEGHLFFMGDNRDNSIDSRFKRRQGIGMVPFENLIGRAEVIALSADGAFWQFWNWRGDRFFRSIE